MSQRARRRALLIPLAAGLTAAACGGAPSTGDFADKAASFIEGDMARNTQLNGLTFTSAVCQEPASTATGTEYTCTAMGSDGVQRTLTAQIMGRNTLQITKLDPGPPPARTGTGSTTPPTTAAAVPPTTAAGG
jgi:hypothetical protein